MYIKNSVLWGSITFLTTWLAPLQEKFYDLPTLNTTSTEEDVLFSTPNIWASIFELFGKVIKAISYLFSIIVPKSLKIIA